MNALVLDADKQERDIIRGHLLERGFSVSESSGGLDMLESMDQFKKDLIVLDTETWGQNGSVYRYFGVERLIAGTPVIVIGKSRRTDIFKDRHPHEKDIGIGKPLDEKEFIQTLEKIV